MAIGETPSEPLIALMTMRWAGHVLSHRNEIAKIAKIAGIAKIENPEASPLPRTVFRSVSSVKISGKDFPPDRAAVPAGTDSPVGFPAESRNSGCRGASLRSGSLCAARFALHHHYAGSEDERQPGRRKRPFGSGPVRLRFHEPPMGWWRSRGSSFRPR